VEKALQGFQLANLHRAFLEVTADNTSAIRIYRSIGFRRATTLYKAVDD
jgi:ribosomal protein S18 acetylase RimI-like enzyme